MDLRLSVWSGPTMFVPTDTSIYDITARGDTVLVKTSLPITVKTVSADGTAQTNGVVVPEVPIGPNITHFTLHEAFGNLILFIDEALNLPFTPNGLDLVVQPDWLEQRGWFRA